MSTPEVKSDHGLNGHDDGHDDLEQHTIDPNHSNTQALAATHTSVDASNPISSASVSATSSSSSSSSDGDSIELRYLIDSAQVGAIIGKNGATVKHIRESSHVYLSIHQKEGRAVERIMSVKGSAGEQSKAAELIAQALIDAFKERRDSLQSNGSQSNANRAQRKQQEAFLAHGTNETSTVLKILVHKSHVGAVIGKAGSTIKEIQSQTGAKIQVSNEPLPLSTDKTMSFSGTPAAIGAAIFSALNEMKKNPMKAGVKSTPYNPATSHSAYQEHPMGFNVNAMQPYMSPLLATSAAYGHSLPAASSSLAQQSQKIAIPTVCAGLVIGKRGNTIKSLRSQSGCFIQIADPEEQTPNERVVTITGTVQGINQAILLIRQLVERYVPPNANGNAH